VAIAISPVVFEIPAWGAITKLVPSAKGGLGFCRLRHSQRSCAGLTIATAIAVYSVSPTAPSEIEFLNNSQARLLQTRSNGTAH
jgi:hypothetical protein